MEEYASEIVPLSPDVGIAASALSSALATAFALPLAAEGMEAGFAAFALTLSLNMPGFTGTPPPGQAGFALQFATVPPPTTHAAAGTALANRIHNWMTTGSAVPASGGPPQNWK